MIIGENDVVNMFCSVFNINNIVNEWIIFIIR